VDSRIRGGALDSIGIDGRMLSLASSVSIELLSCSISTIASIAKLSMDFDSLYYLTPSLTLLNKQHVYELCHNQQQEKKNQGIFFNTENITLWIIITIE
jgi:ABC-type transport system involved in cytochrome c biogenesis ATPase subunit